MKKILHIVPDDKFIDRFKEIDDTIGNIESRFMIKTTKKGQTPIYVKSKMDFNILWTRKNLKECTFDFSVYDFILFHSIDYFVYYILDKIPLYTKIVWFYWGFERYFIFNRKYLYGKKTAQILKNNKRFIDFSLIETREYLKQIRDKLLMILVFNRVNYCVTWIKGDYKEVNYYFRSIKFSKFNYYNFDQLQFESKLSKKGVVLGNSADPSNNHLDALHFLSKVRFKDKIIIPFSYGGNFLYKERLKRNVAEYFYYLEIVFLEEFLSIGEYNKIICSVEGFLFFHKRQQAAGNYISAFFLRKPIYYSIKTTLIEQLEDLGFKLYPLEKFQEFNEIDLTSNYYLAKSLFTIDNSRSQLFDIYSLD